MIAFKGVFNVVSVHQVIDGDPSPGIEEKQPTRTELVKNITCGVQ